MRLESVGQQVDEGPHLDGEMAAVRVDRVDGELDRPELGHELDESAGLDLGRDDEAWGEEDAVAGKRQQAKRFRTVRHEIAADPDGNRHAGRIFEPPLVAERVEGEVQAVVMRKVAWPSWLGV